MLMNHRSFLEPWGSAVPLFMVLAVVVFSLGTAVGLAQDKKADASAEAEIPPPETIDLTTLDGVSLKAMFYPGGKGKESVPVVLLHMFKGSRKDYEPLASHLQREGHAVLVPDLRGHGESTKVRDVPRPLVADSMPNAAFLAMVGADMEACKKFLMEKNNAGELNIEKLCLVGAEMGALVAAEYARSDWSWPVLATGKQGQDVKAMVLISPVWSYRGLQLRNALADVNVRSKLSVLIIVGEDSPRDARDASRLYKSLKRHHPDTNAEKEADRTLFYVPLRTSLQGTKMLDVENLMLSECVALFIKLRLVDQNFPWQDRSAVK